MEEQTLLSAIQQLSRQKNVDGIHEVLQRYPGLLTQTTFLALRKLATQAKTRGDSEGSRFFDEMATWLQGLSQEITATVIANNPTVQLVQKVLAGAISLDAAFVGLRSPEVIRQYGDDVLNALDNLVWTLLEKGQQQQAFLVARLNFEAARNSTSGELRQYSGITLLQLMPTVPQFAELRAQVCEVTDKWLTRADDPELWATLMVEYGNAQMEIATGNKEENIERAIECYQGALEVRTEAALPQPWASTMLNLGSAYVKRRRGDPQENLERAIEIFRQSLRILTRETTPNEWATAMNALGVAYLNRLHGNKADNLEQAISFLESCVQVHTLEHFPVQWAMAQNNLGVAYVKRTRGETAENKELSIEHHEAALRVYTAEDFPVDWAMTNHNLGIAFSERLRGDSSTNLEQAITCFKSALQIRTRELFPYEWAKTMAQLGSVYGQRLRERENAEKAIECYNAALQVLKPDTFADEWAKVMTALGAALMKRKSGAPAKNIEQAIECFEECLKVRTREQFPSEWAEVQSHLGTAFFKRMHGEKAENLERAVAYFQSALTVQTRNEFPEEWATTMMNLGAAYAERIREEKSHNLEKAISCFESALQVCTLEAFPNEWAVAMDNLASAYRDRITGNRATNIERAIENFQEVLKARQREAQPRDWAITTDHLALAYMKRIRGERADNMEQAITLLETALEVLTRENFPLDWARTTNNLASAFAERIYGDKRTNIERAIECWQAALEVATRDTSAHDWALTRLNLGAVYGDRLLGKRAQNFEVALEHSKAALQVLTRQAFPQEWSFIMYNLGNTYRNRILGDHAENLERAIEYYEASLQVRTAETLPELWATSMHSLGTTYYFRIYGERSENIERAIECFHATLQVRSREAFSREWARATHDLGLAFSDREQGDIANNIDEAIKLFEDVTNVHSREAFPYEWIMEMHGLGDAYAKRAHGDRNDNLDRAIEYYEASLQVGTREALPQQWARTMLQLGIAFSKRSRDGLSDKTPAMKYLRQAAEAYLELGLPYETNQSFSALGDVAFDMQQYEDAVNAYSQALEKVEMIRAEALSLKRRAEILQANTRLFDRSIIALMKLDREVQALELAERGKSRTLSDLLTLRDLRPKNTSSETLDQYEQLLFRVRALEDLLRATTSNPTTEGQPAETGVQYVEQIRRELLDAQRQLEELVNVIRQQDKDFLPHAKPLTVEDIKQLARDANATLILFRVTEAGSFVFLIFPDGETNAVRVPKFTTDHLNQLLIRRDDDGSTHGWALQYYVYQSTASEKGNLAPMAFQSWLDTMDSTLGEIYEQLIKPVHQLLKNKLGKGVSSVVMIPNRGLSILPLHACWWNEDGNRRYFLDKFIVRYAPSLSVFQRCVERDRAGRKKDTVFGIANPVPPGNLTFSELECAEIEYLFGNDRCLILSREQATKDAVLHHSAQRHWLHFSCHGKFQLDAPFESSLSLARKESLSLAEILEQLDLRHTWLTVLSACETGLVDFREISDEHYGLPIGFLFAGAPTVWGTLWRVNDLTTALLMIKAYEGLINAGNSKAEAIREAQLWLRDMTATDLEELIQERQTRSAEDASNWTVSTRAQESPASGIEPAKRPFAHPYYWAAMQSVGA